MNKEGDAGDMTGSGWRETVNLFRRKSIFVRMLLLLFVLVLLLALLFSQYTVNVVFSGRQEQYAEASRSLLSQTNKAIDIALVGAGDKITSLAWEPDVINSLVIPDSDDIEQKLSAMARLKSFEDSEPVIDHVYIYIPYCGLVISSDGITLLAENEAASVLVSEYEGGSFAPGRLQTVSTDISVLEIKDKLGLFRTFPSDASLAVLIAEINKESLFRLACAAPTQSGTAVYIYAGDDPVFPQQLSYPATREALLGDAQLIDCTEGVPTRYPSGKELAFSYVGADLGWEFLFRGGAGIAAPDVGRYMLAILPLFLAILLFGLLAAFYIAMTIYRPIQQLALTVVRTQKKNAYEQAKDEWDLLALGYSNAVGENSRLSGIVTKMGPVIEKQLLRDIVRGRAVQEAIDEINSMKSQLSPDRDYVVLISRLLHRDEGPSRRLESYFQEAGAEAVVCSLLDGRFPYIGFFMEDAGMTYVLSVTEDAAETRRSLALFQKELRKAAADLPFDIVLGQGTPCHGLKDLSASFFVASEDLRYRLYSGNPQDEEEPAQEEEFDFGREAIRILQEAAEGSSAAVRSADALVARLRYQTEEKLPGVCERLISAVAEKMVSLHVNPEEAVTLTVGRPPFWETQGREEVLRLISDSMRQAVEATAANGRQSRHKYIRQAEDYVSLHYGDSNLSLSCLSESINLSPNYFSHLFKEMRGRRFVDYLSEYRVEQAKLLLRTTSLTISDVGYKTGFNSSTNFIRVFKKVAGLTPGLYRDDIGT